MTYTTVSNFDTSEDDLGVFYGDNTAYSSGIKSTSRLLSGITAISQDRMLLEQDSSSPLTSAASPSYDTIDEVQSKIADIVTELSGTADKLLVVEHAYDTDTGQYDGYLFAGSVTGISTSNLEATDAIEVASIAKLVNTASGSIDFTNLVHTKPTDFT